MTFQKNKATEANRRFWEHVEAVAERVRQQPEFFNYRTAVSQSCSDAVGQETPASGGRDDQHGDDQDVSS